MASAKDLGRDLSALLPGAKVANAPLPPARTVSGVPAFAGGKIITGDGAGAGIFGAGQLAETLDSRTYHPAVTLNSADGLFSLEMRPVKSITLADAAGNPLTLIFAQPA